MILGFGDIETKTAISIINECYEAIESNKENAKEALQLVEEKYHKKERQYKEMNRMEAPERYSYFWAILHEVHQDSYIVKFSFHHINRRCALSPDGWALLRAHWVLIVNRSNIESLNTKRIFQEV